MKVNWTYFSIKMSILFLILIALPLKYSIVACFFVTWVYQYIVALFFRVHVMPTMDSVCHLGDDKTAIVNFMSATMIAKTTLEEMKPQIRKYFVDKPKLRYKVTEIFGDYYYEDTDVDKSFNDVVHQMPFQLKDERDLEKFVNEELNKPLPLEKAQWRIWWQDDYQGKYSIIVYKQHHSMCDGVSCMNFHIGQGDSFQADALIPIRKVSFIERFIMRATCIFYIPRALLRMMNVKQDLNILNDGVKNLSGKKLVYTSSDLLFKDVKACSKALNVTINDLLTACLASGLKQYMEMKGDTKTSHINIAIPANIRFQHYGSWEKVKFENKFAPVPLTIPLDKDIKHSLSKIHEVTKKMRGAFIDVYATYAFSYYCTMFTPYFIMNWFTNFSTKPYTLAFSNTPGLIKPVFYHGKKSIKMQNYITPAGKAGLAFSCLSYVDYLKLNVSVDEAIMKDPDVLLNLVEQNLKKCLESVDLSGFQSTTEGTPDKKSERAKSTKQN